MCTAAWVEGSTESLQPDMQDTKPSPAANRASGGSVVLAFGGFSGAVDDSLMCIDPGVPRGPSFTADQRAQGDVALKRICDDSLSLCRYTVPHEQD